MSSINQHDYLSGDVEVVVKETVDSFILRNNLTSFDVVKLDIEGSEPFALKGMANTLKTYSPIILIELLDIHLNKVGSSSAEIFDFLKSLGYQGHQIVGESIIKKLDVPISLDGLLLFKKESTLLEGIKIV